MSRPEKDEFDRARFDESIELAMTQLALSPDPDLGVPADQVDRAPRDSAPAGDRFLISGELDHTAENQKENTTMPTSCDPDATVENMLGTPDLGDPQPELPSGPTLDDHIEIAGRQPTQIEMLSDREIGA